MTTPCCFSAFELIILTMVAAIGLFHYWRVLDARAGPAPSAARRG